MSVLLLLAASTIAANQPNVLIYLIDATRQDHVGCYGYERDTTPNIDAFAQRAFVFENMVPQSSWTRPSVASLLTGTYPETHGAEDTKERLRGGLPSLAEGLRAAAYTTIGLYNNPNVSDQLGFGDGFDRWESTYAFYADDKAARVSLAQVNNMPASPWFLYIHMLAPHAPYRPPEECKLWGEADKVDLYDAEIRRADRDFGRVIAALKEHGLYDNTIIIVMSDHGEEFWDHGLFGHGFTLYEEVLKVPFLMKMPGQMYSQRISCICEMVDIAPTLVDIVGSQADPRYEGRSLVPLLFGLPFEERPAYSSLRKAKRHMRMAKTRQEKYLESLDSDNEWVFDLEVDPKERYPHRGSKPELVAHVTQFVDKGESETVELTEEMKEELAGLGYL